MKQFLFVGLTVFTVSVFSFCGSSKKAVATVAPTTYEVHVAQLVTANCSPCHIPAKGGNKLALDTYVAVKENVDSVIARIVKHPGEKGFMPFKRARLSDSTIAVFKQWKTDGLIAK
jgi:mono/diheme cytochrome c family protein